MALSDVLAGQTILGLGLQAYGTFGAMNTASQIASVSGQISQTEWQEDQVRRQAMEISARRSQMEVVRNAQKARSAALAGATASGSQYGSGLQGGYGQISGAATTNLLGINQNLASGEQMFTLNQQIDVDKMNLAQLQGQLGTYQGISSLGSAISGTTGTTKNLLGA